MIRSWKSQAARRIFEGRNPGKGFAPDALKAVRRKLLQLDAAVQVDDLRSPPGNRLHPLTGDRGGQWSIRVNDQYRICFVWGDEGPEDVEFVDYH
ncbi:MAG: Killer protein [Alphaproteobacteria bacterium PA2]|nr:MAG: Killer protein [Alphaproteobacteria bacterium PA2]